MTEAEAKTAVAATPKGAHVWVSWERPAHLRKAHSTMPLTKRTRMLCRISVAYDNKKQTVEARADGSLPATPQELIGRTWETYPTFVRFTKSGLLGLRLESGTFKAKTEKGYFLDGQEIDIEDYRSFCTAREFPKPSEFEQLTFDVKVENILSIHRHGIDENVQVAEAVEA
jgi:hypothetical protein